MGRVVLVLWCIAGALVAYGLAGNQDGGVVALAVAIAIASVLVAWHLLAKKPEVAPETFACSFCGKTNLQVQKLIAGPNCMICNECVGLSKEIILEKNGGSGSILEVAANEVEGVLALRGRVTFAESERLVRAWLILDPSPAACRRAALAAQRANNLSAALWALSNLAPDEWTAGDLLDCAAMHLTDGELEEAAEKIDQLIQRDDLSDVQKGVLLLHDATLRGLDPMTSDEELTQCRELADEGLAAIGALEPSGMRDALLAQGHRARAHVFIRLGKSAMALDEARESVALHSFAESHATLGDAFEATGDDAGAAEARLEALRLAHPESYIARKLTTTSSGPFR